MRSQRSARSARPTEPPGDSPAVLVVTHEPELAETILEALRRAGFAADAVADARGALRVLDEHPVAALIIDAELPLTGGFELAGAVRRSRRSSGAAVILLTDARWSRPQRAAAMRQLGLLDLLSKPIDAVALAETVTRELPPAQGAPPEALADPASVAERRQVEQATQKAHDQPALERGNLQSTPFPRLLHTLYRRRATGALFLLKDNVKKIVYLQEGHPVFVKSNLLSECLGKVLVREQLITEQDCQQSLERMRATRRQQGTVLIEMGVISPQNLVVGLELQLQTKLLDIFSWTRSEFLFKEDARIPAEVIQLPMSNATLIADGIRTRWSEERVRAGLEPYLETYPVAAADPQLRFQELPLDEVEQALRDEMDGSKTLREILAHAPLPDARARAVAYVLITAGIVTPQRGPTPEAAASYEQPSGDEAALRDRLAADLVALRGRSDPFAVLGISPSASDADVEQAYSAQARQVHPDRYRHYSAAIRGLAHEIFGIYFNAHEQIATAEGRQRLREQLSSAMLQTMDDPAGHPLLAEKRLALVRELVEQQAWDDAQRELAPLVAAHEDAADLRALLGWITFNANPTDARSCREATRQLRRAVQLHPRDHQAYIYLGRVYAGMGKQILAEKQFEKALQCKPNSVEALEELKLQQVLRPPRRGAQSSASIDEDLEREGE